MAADPEHTRRQLLWRTKPAVRWIYGKWFERIRTHLSPGPTLEVGNGGIPSGAFLPRTFTSDLAPVDGLDLVCDALALPVASGALANLLAIDVFHHLGRPEAFLEEAHRVLRPYGRLVMIEPYITWLSRLTYGLFHHEPLDTCRRGVGMSAPDKDPWDANLGLVNWYFEVARRPMAGLLLERFERFAVLDYPLSGGFRTWSLVGSPCGFVVADGLERLLAPLARWLACRVLMVFRRPGEGP